MGVPQPFPTIVSVIVKEYICTTWKSIKLNLLWLNLSSTFPRSSTQFTPHLRCVAAIAGERQRQTLTLTNKSDRDACYQLKTTCVARYAVLPNQALIAVGSSAEVEIVMMIERDSLPPPDSFQDHISSSRLPLKRTPPKMSTHFGSGRGLGASCSRMSFAVHELFLPKPR